MRNIKNILITGGAGFIGSHLIKEINSSKKWKVYVLDSLSYAGNEENLKKSEIKSFFKIDIRDREAVMSLSNNSFDAIIHLAAESHVDRSITNPLEFVETNVNGTVNLLELSLEFHKKNPNFIFYHISTDEVFGDIPLEIDEKFEETTPYNPSSPYSASKAASDHFVRAYHKTYNLPIIISNCSNNYGSHQYPEKLIPLVINKLLKREEIPVYGKGLNIRDWIHVIDHARAVIKIIEKGKSGETYCIGGNNLVTNIDLVTKICNIYDQLTNNVDSENLISFVDDRKGHDLKYAINSSKLEKELNWKPLVNLDLGLKETIKWYIDSNISIQNIYDNEKI